MDQEAIARVEACILEAESTYGRKFPRPQILFNIRESSGNAGKCLPLEGQIRLNPFYLRVHRQDMLMTTIPHEVAHWIDWCLHKRAGHGYTWQNIMLICFGLQPKRCHSYTTRNTHKNYVANLDDLT